MGGWAREGLPSLQRRRVQWRLSAGASLQRCGLHDDCGSRKAPVVPSPKASVRAEQPQSVCSQRFTTHGAAPPCLPKPHLRGQGLFCQDSGVFLLLSSLPDLLTVRGVVKAQGLCYPRPVLTSQQPIRPCCAHFSCPALF